MGGLASGQVSSRIVASLAGRARTAIHNDPSPDGGWQEDPWHGDAAPEAAAIIESNRKGWVHNLDAIRDVIPLSDLQNPEHDLGVVLQQLRDPAQHALASEGDSCVSEERLLYLRAILDELIETGVPSGHAVGTGDRVIVALERRTVSDHLWNTLEPLVYASQQGSPIARRSVATTIRHVRRRATDDQGPRASLGELLRLVEDDLAPRSSGVADRSEHGHVESGGRQLPGTEPRQLLPDHAEGE